MSSRVRETLTFERDAGHTVSLLDERVDLLGVEVVLALGVLEEEGLVEHDVGPALVARDLVTEVALHLGIVHGSIII